MTMYYTTKETAALEQAQADAVLQQPINLVYPAPEPIPETEEERKERMWRAVVESCGRSK